MNESEKIIPGGYTDFLNYLDTVTTEEALFSPLTYWFANQNTADDTRDRFDVVADRAKELKLWNGLDLKLERWARTNKEELARIGKDVFGARIGADYAAYRNGKPQQSKTRKLQSYTAKQLSEMKIKPTQYIVEGVLPMGMGLLVAKPKIGKSWMVLDLCLSVASGVPFLGFQTNQHGTRYTLPLKMAPAVCRPVS